MSAVAFRKQRQTTKRTIVKKLTVNKNIKLFKTEYYNSSGRVVVITRIETRCSGVKSPGIH